MKHITLLIAMSISLSLFAQTTALDMMQNDCNGQYHHLFEELDAGMCVVLSFVQLDHGDCADGVGHINSAIAACDQPTSVHHYSIGCFDTNTCPDMLDWCGDHGFNHPSFHGMNAHANYYGGVGEPRAVVLGGMTHSVFYNNSEHHSEHQTALVSAINSALMAATGLEERAAPQGIRIWPNPTEGMLTVSGDGRELRVIDLQGRTVYSRNTDGYPLIAMDLSGLSAGTYILQLITENDLSAMIHFVKL